MSTVDKEVYQIDVECILLPVMDIICKYLGAKDLFNIATVCKSWHDAVLREKKKRYYIQQLRLPYKTENLASMLGVFPCVSLFVYDESLEKKLSLPLLQFDQLFDNIRNGISNGLEKELLQDFRKQVPKLPNLPVVLYTSEHLTTKNIEFRNTTEERELELVGGNGDILGLFFPNEEQRVKIHVAWHGEEDLNTIDEVADYLTEEFGLNEGAYSNFTIIQFAWERTDERVIHAIRNRAIMNGTEVTFACSLWFTVEADVSASMYEIRFFPCLFLGINGPHVESWSTFIYYWAQHGQIEYRLQRLKEKVKRKRHNIGLLFAFKCKELGCNHTDHPCGDSHEMMRRLMRFFPEIQFSGFFGKSSIFTRNPTWHDAFDEDDIFNDDFLAGLENYASIIIISYD